jgi:hypothetical protein
MEHIYGVNSNLILRCDSHIYHVHRDILSQASPVFMSLLEGPFAEASTDLYPRTDIITLEGDNPASLKVVIDIIFSGILDLHYGEIFEVDSNLDTIVNKYDLTGVRNVITFSRKMDKTVGNSERKCKQLKLCLENTENELWPLRKVPAGSVVNYNHRPPIGTKVVLNDNYRRRGVIIANDEDNRTEIGVRWDDGTERHNLQCCKKNQKDLLYL